MINIGDVCHVWETKGVRNLKQGPGTSEKTGGDYPDISPREDLVCTGKRKGSKWPFRRKDGTTVWVHLNHLCPCQPFNPQPRRVKCQFHDVIDAGDEALPDDAAEPAPPLNGREAIDEDKFLSLPGVDGTAETKAYLLALSKGITDKQARRKAPNFAPIQSGLYVQWLANPTTRRVRDKQHKKRGGKQKTELLPLRYALKAGKFSGGGGYLGRRNFDYGQLHVPGDTQKPMGAPWKQDSDGNWLVYADCFRQIHVFPGSTGKEAELLRSVKAWLDQRGLRIARENRLEAIRRNNQDPSLERIGDGDWPNEGCEWLHVRRFDEDLFGALMEFLENALYQKS